MSEMNDTQAALHAGSALGEPRLIEGVPHVLVPDGYQLEALEQLLRQPLHHKGTHTASDADGFVALWKRFSSPGDSVIFSDLERGTFDAVFDYADLVYPRWARHRAVYAVKPSLEWRTWTGSNRRKMPQVEFAEFIENNLADIVRPDAAAVLEVATHLTAHREVKFEAATRLANGQNQFRYDETIRGTTKAGTVEIPERFVLAMPPFANGIRYELEARLRYRINGGDLVMWYDLFRPEQFWLQAIQKLQEQLQEKTGKTFIQGAPA